MSFESEHVLYFFEVGLQSHHADHKLVTVNFSVRVTYKKFVDLVPAHVNERKNFGKNAALKVVLLYFVFFT